MRRRPTRAAKRSLFRELMAGVDAMCEQREGRLTLRAHHVEPIALRELEPRIVRDKRRVPLPSS